MLLAKIVEPNTKPPYQVELVPIGDTVGRIDCIVKRPIDIVASLFTKAVCKGKVFGCVGLTVENNQCSTEFEI